MRKIFWSPEAAEDVRTIYRFYLPKDPKFALFLYKRIREEARRLKRFPEIAIVELGLIDCTDKVYRSLVVLRMFKLIYYVELNHINIVAVWDCRQDPEILKQQLQNR